MLLLLRGELWTLPVEAPADSVADSVATALKIQADALDPEGRDGRVLIGNQEEILWLNPTTGATEPAGPGFKRLTDLAHTTDGTIYAMAEWTFHAIQAGKELTNGWPKASLGERPQ